MKKPNSRKWRMLIAAMAMLTVPMVADARNNSLYPPGIGFNPLVDYDLPNFAQSPNIRKFVDKLPGLGAPGCTVSVPAGTGTCNENNLGQYIPLAQPDTTTYPGSDYYEIGAAKAPIKMSSDLPPTPIRLYYQKNGVDHSKQYLGVAILAHRDRPTRVKMTNELGIGVAGKLGLAVDTTLIGSGTNATGGTYTENRISTHLHGGATPWISDGTPHQWFAPAGDPSGKGPSFANVPDMITGGTVPCIGGAACYTPTNTDGIGTFYYSNEQSSRLMFYHDHAVAITRLNVYAGLAGPYLVTDNFEEDLISGTNTSGANPTNAKLLPDLGGAYHYGIPLVVQDKAYVNDATTPPGVGFPAPETGYVPQPYTSVTDPLWYTWVGTPGGSLWEGHEYLPVENPFDPSGNTPTGRWDYGPFLIPPAAPLNLTLPSPTIVPEAFLDTAVVNGTAFPYVELPPDVVRFRILNACDSRTVNLQLYKADPLRINVTHGGSGYSNPTVTVSGPGTVASATATVVNGIITAIDVTGAQGYPADSHPTVTISGAGTGATAVAVVDTEVKMVPASPNKAHPTWPVDGRDGGVPDPTTAGPPWIQIGNEGGFLAKVAVVPSQPVDYELSRQNIPFLGVTGKSLLLMPAMRADVLVDLSQYHDGDTLIVYNDAPAPTPGFWPLNDYYTDDPDLSATGGAVTTPPGFGPNTRTFMQIRIKGTKTSSLDYHSDAKPGFTRGAPNVGTLPAVETPATDGASLKALKTILPLVFAAGQDKIIVPQLAYNGAYPVGNPLHFNGTSNNYVQGYQTTYSVSGTPTTVATVLATGPGNNYLKAPTITLAGGFPPGCVAPACVNATATAYLNPIGAVTLLTAGTGFTSAPTVTLGAPTNAAGTACTPAGAACTTATAVATISGGIVTNISMVDPGSGYTNILTAPTCTITGGGGTGATCSVMIPTANQVGHIAVTNPGAGYVAQPQVYITRAAGDVGTGAIAVARLTGDVPMTGKNITEGFDVEYGRLDIRLGSTPNPLTPNVGNGFVVGLARYIDPPTEIMNDGELVLWRFSHLGVDSHVLHFHLFNMQVINRVDWTNVIKQPYPDEIGWREVLRTNPMEDLIVAIKPYHMTLPFPIPNSIRPLDETTPLNSTTNFYPVPPPAGIPAVPQQSNVLTNFGWEYVWHCHLLGHEENDMMRPIVFVVATAKPPVPNLATNGVASAIGKNTLTWTEAATTSANAPTGFIIERATGATSTTYTTIATTHNTTTTYVDSTTAPSTVYRYRVSAYNLFGASNPSTVRNSTATAWTAPSVVLNAPVNGSTINLLTASATAAIPLTATPTAGGTATVTKVDFYNGSSLLGTAAAPGPYTFNFTGANAGAYSFTAKVTNSLGLTAVSAAAAVTVTKPAPLVISTGSVLPSYTVSPIPFSVTMGVTGGIAPFTWAVNSGSTLPAGLTLTTAGVLSGIPSAGTYNFNLKVTDSEVPTVTVVKPFVLVVTNTATAATMTLPISTSPLPGASVTFAWTNAGASLYQVWVGTAPGAADIGMFPAAGTTGTSTTVTGLPVNGSLVYVRLWSLVGSTWLFNDYVYTAAGTGGATTATMVSPANLATISGASQPFTWTNSGASLYQIWVGSTPGGNDLGMLPPAGTTGTTYTTTGLPTTGTLYVRLWSLIGATWSFNDYSYTAGP